MRAVAWCALPLTALATARGILQPPMGDEPHYLVVSDALARYRSLDVQRVYDQRDYAAFYPLPLDPHVVVGPDGVPLPLHAIGGPLLWLLPWALAGRAGVLAFMVVVTLLVVHTVERLLRELGIRPGLATGVAVATGLGTPLLWYAGMAFVEPIGALGCVLGLRVLHQRDLRPRDLALAGAALGVLPWVHGRFLWFVLVLALLLALRVARERRAWLPALLVPLGVLGAALLAYDLAVWHTVSPVANQVGGGAVPFRIAPGLPLLGLLVDQEAGILPSFPVALLVLPGLLLAATRPRPFPTDGSAVPSRRLTLHVLLLAVPYLLTVATFEAWDGAWSPPARFLAVVVPLFAGHVALAVERAGRAGVALLAALTALGTVQAAIAVVTPTGGFSTAVAGSPVLAWLADAGLDLRPFVPSVDLPGQTGPILAWCAGVAVFAGLVVGWSLIVRRRRGTAMTERTWIDSEAALPAVGGGG